MSHQIFNKQLGFNHTIKACFTGYIVQAIINNFAPLLFLTFHTTYNLPLSQITLLVTINFGIQLIVDLLSAGFIDKLGYRFCIMTAHLLSGIGLILLGILPELIPNPLIGLLIAVATYAIGGGLLEVLVSPIVEACPTERKEATMSMLHSFYCWGHVAVVLLSTLYFNFFGIENWRYLAFIWALIPLANLLLFAKVPIRHLVEETGQGLSIKELVTNQTFWLMMLLMACAGASEQGISQWASTFAEVGLGITKTAGDLAGPMLFAVMMGTSRAIYGKYAEKIKLEKFMLGSTLLCMISYLLVALSPWPVIGLIGCSICGFSVGILWPGTFSLAAAQIRRGGTALFALLALAGDLGCAGGPTFVGIIADLLSGGLKVGILWAVIFPALMLLGILGCMHTKKSIDSSQNISLK